jgi:hypothetical protein
MGYNYNKMMAARASAVLTNGEVAATRIDIAECCDAELTVRADFTVGNLTNVILRCYVSADGTTYDLLYGPDGTACVYTLTATDTLAISVPQLSGYKFFRVTAQGTDDFTNSLLALWYKYDLRGSRI